jgi:hypothetical protein
MGHPTYLEAKANRGSPSKMRGFFAALRMTILRTVTTGRTCDNQKNRYNRKSLLFCFVLFEELAGFFEVERVSVDDELVFSGVCRDVDDFVDTMTVLAESLDDEVDVYHG